MANRTAFQTTQAELPIEVFSGRQWKCNKNPNLLHSDSQPADDCNTKETKEKLGIFKPGKFLQNTPVQLHSSAKFPGKSR